MRLLNQAPNGSDSSVAPATSQRPHGAPFLVVPNPEFINVQVGGALSGAGVQMYHSLSKNGPWYALGSAISALGITTLSNVVNSYIKAVVSGGDGDTLVNVDITD